MKTTWSVRLLALCALFLAATGLLNWIAQWHLSFPFHSVILMKTNTAIGLLGLSFAVLLHSFSDQPGTRTAAKLCAGLAACIGIATFAEHLFHIDLGIDQLLFVEAPGAPATVSPNRMGPPTTVMLSILGVVLTLLPKHGNQRRNIQWLALVTLTLSIIPLAGYLFGANDLYEIPQVTGIAPHTALCLLILSVATIFLRPELPPIELLFRSDAGGELARRLIPVAVLLPPTAGLIIAKGRDAQLIDVNIARVMLQILVILPLVGFVAWTARHLSQVSQARDRAQNNYDRARVQAEDLAAQNFETTSLLDRLLDSAPLGLAVFDNQFRVVRINPFMATIHGQEAASQIGRGIKDFLPQNADQLETLMAEVLRASRSIDGIEICNTHSTDDNTRWFQCELFPVPDRSRAISLVGMVMIEVTERKRIDQEKAALLESERNARAEAERAGLLKDEFLATLSHELRTPLTSIVGWSHILLAKQYDNPDLQRGLTAIDRNAKSLSQLINDLLDVSRIISGKLQLNMLPMGLHAVVNSALESVTPSAEAKGVFTITDYDSHPLQVMGDPSRLQQVVWNLLTNAVKFTPRDGTIRISLRRVGREARIVIADSGVGVKPEFLPHMFERFRQADASTTRRFGGLGLGLSIVRQLTELHAGTVSVHSDGPNLGTIFTVNLPLTTASQSADEFPDDPPLLLTSAPHLEGTRVLIVDDEADTRTLVVRILEETGAVITSAASVDEALSLIESTQPQLLISDIGMPFRDGYELIRLVRAQRSAQDLPAIALTAFARPEDRDRCLAAGYQLHVRKPVPPQELLHAVASLLERDGIATDVR